MSAIDETTVPYRGLNYLRPDILLDFISVTTQSILSVTPIAILYSTVGVLQCIELRKIPVDISGRTVYPMSSLENPWLYSKLIINEGTQKLRFQGTLVPQSDENTKSITLLGLALEFAVSAEQPG